MAMYFTIKYQAVCYDADSVLGEGGGWVVESSVLASQMYVRAAQVGYQLPGRSVGRCRSQLAGHRSAGSYSRPVQIDGDAVSMTRGRASEVAGTGAKKAKVDRV